MAFVRWNYAALPLALAALGLISGCGTAEYESLLTKSMNEMRTGAPFRKFFAPTELPDTPVKIRLPMAFKTSYLENSPHPDDGAKISPDRLQPPFLPLPGFKLCYEGFVESVANRPPFYCYLAAFPSKPGDAEKWEADFQAKLKAIFKDAPEQWETVDAVDPQGKARPWKKIQVRGPQSFRIKELGKVVPRDLDGVFELWLYDASDYIVLIGWRAPNDAERGAPAPAAPGGAASTAAVERFELATWPVLTAGTMTIDAASGAPPADAPN